MWIGGVVAALVVGVAVGVMLGRRWRPGPEPPDGATADRSPVGAPALEEAPEEPAVVAEPPAATPDLEAEVQDLKGLQVGLRARIEELETELRRYRRWASDHLQEHAAALEQGWSKARLPHRVHDLPDEVDPEPLARLRAEGDEVRSWIDEFGLGTAEMRFQLGLLDALDGQRDRAAGQFQLAAHHGVRPEGWLALGDVQWLLGRPKKAARAYEQCLEAPRMPEHLFERCAEVALAEHRDRAGLEVLERVLRRTSPSVRAYELAAVLHGRLGEYDRALAVCERGLERHPESATLRARMIVPLGRLGAAERAEGCARRARELEPGLALTPVALGLERLLEDRLDDAEALFREAVELDPDCAEAHCQLGIIANHRGQYAAALKSLRHAVKLKPDYAEAYFNMKDAYEGLRDFDNAIATLKRAVQLNPNYA